LDIEDEPVDLEDVAIERTFWQLFWAQEYSDTMQVWLSMHRCPSQLLSIGAAQFAAILFRCGTCMCSLRLLHAYVLMPLQKLAAQQARNTQLTRQVEAERASSAATMAVSDKLAQVHTLTWTWSA
jgi:hypothetical protein